MQLPVRKRAQLLRPMEPDSLVLTPEAISALKREHARLLAGRPEAIAEVRRTAEMGDFSENAAYQMAKGRLRSINDRLLIVEDKLARATVLTPPTNGRVGLGSTVTARKEDGSEQVWKLVSRAEVNMENGWISDESPIGQALLGASEGSVVEVQTNRAMARYTVLRVQ